MKLLWTVENRKKSHGELDGKSSESGFDAFVGSLKIKGPEWAYTRIAKVIIDQCKDVLKNGSKYAELAIKWNHFWAFQTKVLNYVENVV